MYMTFSADWERISSKLRSIPHNNLQDILKSCYEGLDKSLKDTFLDICCFFIGKDRSYVVQTLNDCGFCGEMYIRILIELKFITIDKNNKLGMQAVLQEMGQEISHKRSKAKWTYIVFLSFRGKETCRSFVSRLYATLTNASIKVFMDDEKLERGENISASLMSAIEGSRISLVIFSTNYARSKWCLEELEKIMECQKTMHEEVLQIFYDVDPSEVQHQRGNFGEAFQQLINRTSASKYKVMNWKRALTGAANLSGWDSRSYSTDVEVIDDILETITTKIDDNMLFVAEHPVGVEFCARDMS
ncbi:hypothetical protein L6164_002956 [Bauhinia variegata]|uniref:Uncharacterized protein n=1 Tax=Bauhinia variegata TaxID=167791 RepID=A0ACB9PZT8_BAUVA|nr:hypothetical protein L6164_002956 [Bauhinia variegata]